MNKKIAIAITSNVALALLMTTGCRSLTTGRTVFGDNKVDPYTIDSTPQVTIETPDDSTVAQVTPVEVTTEISAPIETPVVEDKPYVPPTVTETSASYQKYIVPTDYQNPTEGLTPTKGRPDHKKEFPTAPVTTTKDQKPEVVDGDYFIYVVKPGDCLSVIANSNGVRTKELAELNGLKPDAQVRIGQKLKVPAGRKPFTNTPKTVKEPAVDDGSIYVVKSGDCLSIIAQNLGVKTADLMAANNLKNANNIYVGQKLKIPGKAAKVESKKPEAKPVAPKPTVKVVPPTPTTIPPAPKSDAFDIDQPADADPFAPVAAEGEEKVAEVKEEIKEVADEIAIPAPIEAEEATAEDDPFSLDIDSVIENFDKTANSQVNAVIEKFDTLKVSEGDTLDLIATNYGTTADALRKLNGFDNSRKLKAGDIIKVPSQSLK